MQTNYRPLIYGKLVVADYWSIGNAFRYSIVNQVKHNLMAKKPNIVLVHGAWGDGSCWSKVITILKKEGYPVVATQHPLTSLADDVEVTRRLAELQDGPVLLVGHSYGGCVITEAANKIPNAVGLVYIAAFAPEVGESIAELGKKGDPPPGSAAVRPDKYGSLWLDRELFHENFCGDVEKTQAEIMAVVQKPIAAKCFEDKITDAGWKNLPSWYQVSMNDRMIPPPAEKFMSERIKSKNTVSLATSHASMVAMPQQVADLILMACQAAVATEAKAMA